MFAKIFSPELHLSSSTVGLNHTSRRGRELRNGHGSAAIRPSDTSDSGSDILIDNEEREIGDATLKSDTHAKGVTASDPTPLGMRR